MTAGLPAEPVFVVFRAARGLPPGWAGEREGRWYLREELLAAPGVWADVDQPVTAVAIPTDRVEHRDSDGAVAQVWELHPPGGNYANDGDVHDLSHLTG